MSTEPEIVTSSGETAVLPCATEGSPQPSIEWTKENGESIKLGDDNSRYKLLLDGSLQIEDVNQNDTGNYVCTASNPAGTAQKSTRLIIQGMF